VGAVGVRAVIAIVATRRATAARAVFATTGAAHAVAAAAHAVAGHMPGGRAAHAMYHAPAPLSSTTDKETALAVQLRGAELREPREGLNPHKCS